jgi:hypothetical protein
MSFVVLRLTTIHWRLHRGAVSGAAMDLTGAGYFYALAALAMAFVGFTSIVVVLHQTTGRPLTPFQVLITRLFAELGLMATVFAMLAPTLALFGLREILVWRISSTIMLAVMVPWLAFYPLRRRVAVPGEKFPARGHIMNAFGTIVVILLCMNVFGSPFAPGPGPLALAALFVLAYATVSFFWTYTTFLRE